MIEKIFINSLGTISFMAKFPRMRKAQDFIVYPIQKKEVSFYIQSDTRMGQVNIETGRITMSKPHSSGAYAVTLMMDEVRGQTQKFTLSEPDLQKLKEAIRKTAGEAIGNNALSVTCDNSGAAFI